MRKDHALTFFNVNQSGLARVLGVSKQLVSKWGEVIPLDHAARLAKLSCGSLAIDWPDYDERGKPRS